MTTAAPTPPSAPAPPITSAVGGPIIAVRGLSRIFTTRRGTVEAVRGVDLTVRTGEIVGFLGPNGAGKTTTLRMLTTLLRPTSGEATVAGCDLRADPAGVRRRIGYVAQGSSSEPGATVLEELVDHARLYGIDRATAAERARDLVGRLELGGLEDRLVKTLSGGQKRRLEVALGMVHQPALIFLDEPTTGLDPQSRANLWDHIRALRDEAGATVFLTTHYLEEADALCDRILVIDDGRIIAEGTPDELKRGIGGDLITVVVASDAEAARAAVAGLAGVREVTLSDPATLRITVEEGDRALAGVLRSLDGAGAELTSVTMARASLDDVFLTLTGRTLREAQEAGSQPARRWGHG